MGVSVEMKGDLIAFRTFILSSTPQHCLYNRTSTRTCSTFGTREFIFRSQAEALDQRGSLHSKTIAVVAVGVSEVIDSRDWGYYEGRV